MRSYFGFASLLSCSLFLTSGTAAPSPTVPPPPGLPAGLDIGELLSLDLVKHINVLISLASLTDNLVTVNFDVENSLPLIPLVINKISSNAGVNNTVFATFTHTFNPPLVIDAGQTVNSGNISNVLLPQGATNSLDIIPGGVLDIDSDVVVFGIIPLDGLEQNNVPTTFDLDI